MNTNRNHNNQFLSKDYNALYDLLCKGQEAVGFVNYKFRSMIADESIPPCRDVCQIRRRDEFDIDFVARGISYGSVGTYSKGKVSELTEFLAECKRMDLEWAILQPSHKQIKYKHVKSGNVYMFVENGRMQLKGGEWVDSVNYRNEQGEPFTREKKEFDEKFILLE